MNNNSTPLDILVHEGHVTSLAIPFWTQPGFAIPLVQSRHSSNIAYVQRVNISRQIVGFDPFNGKSRTAFLEDPMNVRIGDNELFALIDPDGTSHAGPQNMLAPLVRKWVKFVEPPLVRMNFARFCGEDSLAVRSAAEVVELKSSELKSSERAIRWFIDAIVIVDLFGALAEDGNLGAGFEDTAFDNALVSVELGKDHLSIELPATLFERDHNAGRAHNSKIAKTLEFARMVLGRRLELRAASDTSLISSSQKETANRIRSITAELSRLTRQEQRVALIIKSILEYPPLSEVLLTKYSDGTNFTQATQKLLYDNLHHRANQHDVEQRIAGILPKIISRAYPRQRGRLILDLALVLDHFHYPAMVLHDITARSQAEDVIVLKAAIMHALNR